MALGVKRRGSVLLICLIILGLLGGLAAIEGTRWLPLLSRMHYQNMHRFVMNRDQRNRCLSLMMDYYHHHLPGMGTVRSVEVLQQLFV